MKGRQPRERCENCGKVRVIHYHGGEDAVPICKPCAIELGTVDIPVSREALRRSEWDSIVRSQ